MTQSTVTTWWRPHVTDKEKNESERLRKKQDLVLPTRTSSDNGQLAPRVQRFNSFLCPVFFENTFSIVRHLPHGGKRMAHIGDDFFVDFSKYFFSFPTEIVIQESAFNTWPEYGTDSYGCSSNIMRDIFFFFFFDDSASCRLTVVNTVR